MIETGGISLDISATARFLTVDEIESLAPRIAEAARDLEAGACAGAEFLGWLDLPATIGVDELALYAAAAERAREDSEIYVVVGIGGSYLGAGAVLDALAASGPGFGLTGPEIVFAGNGLCAAALDRVLQRIAGRDFRLCVISKSGTTLEPAATFRLLRAILEERYGVDGAATRITAVTDADRGALRQLANAEGWQTFVIPDDVGGRFSVLTPVGMVPLAVGGVDVAELVAGARSMRQACVGTALAGNPAHMYAAVRYLLYEKGYTTEVLSSFHSGLQTLQEWWKQLFGESEGKQGRGIFPASTVFTTDLHSLGQYVQDGRRNLQETFLCVRDTATGLAVPTDRSEGGNLDGLNYLAGRTLDEINWTAYEGTRNAHVDGGVPCQTFTVDRLDAATVGGLIYLFERAVAVGGLLLGVNPFDQPGVEAYKQEMFRLLGRP